MSLWTEEIHEEHLKDLLRASVQIRIARQAKERQQKSQKYLPSLLVWLLAYLSAFK